MPTEGARELLYCTLRSRARTMVWSGLRGGGGYFWRTMVLKDLILAFGYLFDGRCRPPSPTMAGLCVA